MYKNTRYLDSFLRILWFLWKHRMIITKYLCNSKNSLTFVIRWISCDKWWNILSVENSSLNKEFIFFMFYYMRTSPTFLSTLKSSVAFATYCYIVHKSIKTSNCFKNALKHANGTIVISKTLPTRISLTIILHLILVAYKNQLIS